MMLVLLAKVISLTWVFSTCQPKARIQRECHATEKPKKTSQTVDEPSCGQGLWSSPYRLINTKDRIFSEVVQNPKTIRQLGL